MTDTELLRRIKDLSDLMLQPTTPEQHHEYDLEIRPLLKEMDDRDLTIGDLPT